MTKKKVRSKVSVRIGCEAIEPAKRASALYKMTLADYTTLVLMESARRDNNAWANFQAGSQRIRDSF